MSREFDFKEQMMSGHSQRWLTVEEAAVELRVSPETIEGMITRGELGGALVGAELRIPVSAMAKFARKAERGSLSRWQWRRPAVAAAGLALLVTAAGVMAAGAPGPGETVPRQIPYRGVLEDSGVPVTNAAVAMTFELYTTESDGSPVWTEQQSVSVQDGDFLVALGDVTPIPAALMAQPSLYLAVRVGEDQLIGRQRILSVPYAHQAAASVRSNHASTADRATSAANVDSVPSGAVMFFSRTTCPSGWSELTGARGRAIVGLHPGGGLEAVVADPLNDRGTLSHQHTTSHNHGIDFNSALSTSYGWRGRDNNGYHDTGYFVTDTMSEEVTGQQHYHRILGSTATVNAPSSWTAHTFPYLQLLVCKKV